MQAAASARPLANWLDVPPWIRTRPPPMPCERMTTGGQSPGLSAVASTPSARRASSRSPIGRCRIRAVPSSRYVPCPSPQTAARNRIVVPLAAQSIVAAGAGIAPAVPSSRITPAGQSAWSETPSAASPAAITRVSWLSSTPVSRLGPRASAAQTSARLVMLFEPGGRALPLTGPATTGIGRGSVMASLPEQPGG